MDRQPSRCTAIRRPQLTDTRGRRSLGVSVGDNSQPVSDSGASLRVTFRAMAKHES